jgi:histidinol-phosphate aminotransferase
MSALTTVAKKWVAGLSMYEPGRPIEEVAREIGLDPNEVIKLASNENALGPSPKALAAMRESAGRMHLYPDGDNFYLSRALGKKLGIAPDHLFFGHGSNEIIALLGHVYLEPGANIVVSQYAFVVYRLVAALYQAQTVTVPASAYGHDLDAMLRAITPETRLVFIANPNNPTGTLLEQAALDRFIAAVPPSVVVVLDEAYIELLDGRRRPDTLKYIHEGRPVILLRTFSKTYGLAGLRIGYAVAAPECVKLLHRVRQPFNVNAMAQAAALAALEDDAHVERTREMTAEGLAYLARAFDELGLEYVPSAANFVLVKVGRGRELFDALRRQGVIVRPVDNYGLPEFVRITVGTRAENERLVDALRKALVHAR